MTPPQITRCSTSNEEVMSDSEASMASDEASSISTLPSVPGTMSPLPSGRRKNRSRGKTRGSKTPRVQVSNVNNSPNMVVVVGNGKDSSLGQSNGLKTEYLKNPIVEDQAQETGIDSTERSGNAVRDCPNCEVFRKEIQDKNAKLEKIKAKNCKLKSEKDELNEKLQSFEASLQLLTQQNNEFKSKLTAAGCKIAEEQLAVCKNAMQPLQERINDLENSKLQLEEEKRAREEKLSLEKEQLVEKMGQESAIAMEQFAANCAVRENAMQERMSDLEDYAFALEEELRASKEKEELAARENERLKNEIEALNSTVKRLKEEGRAQGDCLASSRIRAKNQRKFIDALKNQNDELERSQLDEATTPLATERQLVDDLVNLFHIHREVVEGREEGNRVLHEELQRMLDNLRDHQQPVHQFPNEQIINDVQLPQQINDVPIPQQVDIVVLSCVSDVHVPD